MTRPRSRAPEWLVRAGLGLAIAALIAGATLGALLWARARAVTSAAPSASGGDWGGGATLDGLPGSAEPTLEELRAARVIELSDESGLLYRMYVSDASLKTLRYYGLPAYPDAVAVTELDPDAAESAESEAYDTGAVAELLTPDDPETVREWFRGRLHAWSLMESPEVGILFRQEPSRRRSVSITALAESGLVLIAYGVIPESQPAPFLPEPQAALKAEQCWRLRTALQQFRADTGKDAESLGELLAESGEEGYRGPYLEETVTDPYTGGAYEVKDGEVVGPGDVERFSY